MLSFFKKHREEKKASADWNMVCRVEIIDADGWDRKNFKYSWYKEKITRKEFERRLMASTCQFPWKGGLWKGLWLDLDNGD